MTPEKIIEVAEYYQHVLREVGAVPSRMDIHIPLDEWSAEQDLNHLLYTAEQIPRYIALGKTEKANRHLGWLQRGVATHLSQPISFGMNLNKPDL